MKYKTTKLTGKQNQQTAKMTRSLYRILLLCFGCLSATLVQATEELIVFEARGNILQPGDVVNSDVMISLDKGQSLTLIARNGKVIRLQGSYRGLPLDSSGANTKDLSDALKALMISQSDSDELGVTRDTTAIIKNSVTHGWVPEPWVINITHNGNACVQEGQPVVLWRKDSSSIDLQLNASNGYQANTMWPNGETKIATPADLPIINGGSYHFTVGNEEYSNTLHVIPETIDNLSVVASWMLEKGCEAQAVALLQ